ncbi:hypothetical protein LPJ53_004910 [Coemansia erecta]|uniref:Uncharacterized protein n=1 Tax=Coemansia erecta TaxID=147472 RepID=A0A9W8CPB4_9FUNG|nr:hypothetical protein LPJ53_004910 [Coemansia erecta]
MDSSTASARVDANADTEAAPRSQDPQPAYPDTRPPSQSSLNSPNASNVEPEEAAQPLEITQPLEMEGQIEAAEPGTRVSWQCSETEAEAEAEAETESGLVVRRAGSMDGQSIGGATAGRHSATSSLYGGSASLVGNSSLVGFGGPAAGAAASGTLSPQYTLVNSDGASLRVHTGSIRERHMHRRISAIHEDDSDAAYPESRRSDSLIFVPHASSSSRASSVLSRRRRYRGRHAESAGNGSSSNRSQRVSADGDSVLLTSAAAAAAALAATALEAASGAGATAAETLGEGDCFSMLSGISEGGASTTRVRMATDRAYDALRIGPGANYTVFGYGHHHNHHHRPMSFATSSDPGLPSAGSFYDYYLGPDDYVPNSGSTRDGYPDSDSDADQNGDIVSLIRSDVAVYSGAGDDVKFPFLPDNFSEFSGSIVYSPGGALSVDVDRLSRDQSEYSFVSPAQHHYYFQNQEVPVQPPQDAPSSHSAHRYRPHMTLRKRGKTPEGAGSGSASTEPSAARATAASESPLPPPQPRAGHTTLQRVNKRPGDSSGPVSPTNLIGLHRRYNSRRYRNQSASHAYTSAAQAVAEAVAATVRSTPSSPTPPVSTTQPLATSEQQKASPPPPKTTQSSHRLRSSTTSPTAIRPNAIMRFFKRITPKN